MKIQENTLLIESAWEVCNQVGGIYTVIRSKVPAITRRLGDNYISVGPYFASKADPEFEHMDLPDTPVGKAVKDMWDLGLEVHYGKWLISGRPITILFNTNSIRSKLGEISSKISSKTNTKFTGHDPLLDDVMLFGELYSIFLEKLNYHNNWSEKKIILHFHKWMSVSHLSKVKERNWPYKVVFTTHATLLGRYLAMNDSEFYDHLPFYDWHKESSHFYILPQVTLERIAAQNCDVLSTVSNITARECTHLLGRDVDAIVPNGLNIERFKVEHKIESLHTKFKEKIHQFIMGHFFHNYSFDLKKTIYIVTSGRFEYKNKGYDLTLESMARLNHKLQQAGSDVTVVLFLVTKVPTHSINPQVLESRAVMEELKKGTTSISQLVQERLFLAAASDINNPVLPDLNQFVDDYWRLRFRRTMNNWKSDRLPPVTTHNLVDDSKDEVLNFIRNANLINNEHDRVKIIYHPEFISDSSPLFGMEYNDFIRGCHIGIFPSYYEPWGYTPLECMANAIPSITSNLAGFGDFVYNNTEGSKEDGMFIIDRVFKDFNQSADQIADVLFEFSQLESRQRIQMRQKAEVFSYNFDWEELIKYYLSAYEKAIEK